MVEEVVKRWKRLQQTGDDFIRLDTAIEPEVGKVVETAVPQLDNLSGECRLFQGLLTWQR
jgi:phage host-nuclease inhibitor protein Gam